MYVWQLTQAEFVGINAAGKAPAPSIRDWSNYAVVGSQYASDTKRGRRLTGRNGAYLISPTLQNDAWFLVHDTSLISKPLVGFYDDNFLAVDQLHGARGLAEELVIAAEDARGVAPNKTRQLNTQSEKAFVRAHQMAVRRAHADFEDVPQQVLQEYELRPLYRQRRAAP